jgi:hypothetical protein
MRRLMTMLAAGLLAAATVLTTVGVASAGATTASHASLNLGSCTTVTIRLMPTKFFIGTPNHPVTGDAVFLRTKNNLNTRWLSCGTTHMGVRSFLSLNGLFALTSRGGIGAAVTLEPRHGGDGFRSQQWTRNVIQSGRVFQYQNRKTGLWLRVRNGGPVLGQTVTTGNSRSNWVVVAP